MVFYSESFESTRTEPSRLSYFRKLSRLESTIDSSVHIPTPYSVMGMGTLHGQEFATLRWHSKIHATVEAFSERVSDAAKAIAVFVVVGGATANRLTD